jgi:hypothetical protein
MAKPKISHILPPRGSTREYEIHAASKVLSRPLSESFEHPREAQSQAYDRIGDPDLRARPRVFDLKTGCYVLAEKPRDVSRDQRRRARRGPVHIPDGSGRFWWVGCKVSGHRIIRIEAMDHRAAETEALRLYPKLGRHEMTIRSDGQGPTTRRELPSMSEKAVNAPAEAADRDCGVLGDVWPTRA